MNLPDYRNFWLFSPTTAIDTLEQTLLYFHQYEAFLPEEFEFLSNMVLKYRQLDEDGAFHPDNTEQLKNSDWDPSINFRYGVQSINGTTAEIFAMGLQNTIVRETRYAWIFEATQQSEVAGIDLLATNKKWKKGYPVQVKYVRNIHNFFIRPDWMKYKKGVFDRFVLVDMINGISVELNYIAFTHKFNAESTIGLSNLISSPVTSTILP